MQTDSPAQIARRDGCPFCSARLAKRPKPGERVILLNGFRAGMVGTVSRVDMESRLPPATFLIKADGDRPGTEQIIHLNLDLFLVLSSRRRMPRWLPPLILREAAEVHEVVLIVCNRFAELGAAKWRPAIFYRLIEHCWRKRLPLTGDEIWELLVAHGMLNKFEKEARRLYIEGTELLVYTHGRKPINKKRITPLPTSTANPTVERDARKSGARPSP